MGYRRHFAGECNQEIVVLYYPTVPIGVGFFETGIVIMDILIKDENMKYW